MLCIPQITGRLLALRLPRLPLIPPFRFPKVQAKNDASPRKKKSGKLEQNQDFLPGLALRF
jgi:hypothetical protein